MNDGIRDDWHVWRDPAGITVVLLATLTVMAAATISPVLPGLQQMFAGEPDTLWMVQWLVPAPSLAVIVMAPLSTS